MNEQEKSGFKFRRAPVQRFRPGAVTLIVSALALTLSACASSGSSSAAAAPSAVASASAATSAVGEGSHVTV